MTSRGVLSPLTNTPISHRKPPVTKYVSPSTSRQTGLSSLVTPSASSLLTETHDDEKERRDRRRSRIMELQRNLGTSPGGSPDRRGTPLNGLTSTQLAEHYTNCIQLSAENKINSKNAFGLHLIDYMAELLKKRELENFQVASSTLDASAKIYAGRVDFIHSETYKVLSGLGTGKTKEGETQDDDAPAEDCGEGEEEQKKKRKTKSKIIRTNLKSINVNKFDIEFEVDPMFQVMSATFDEGGASGLLLNHLRCYDDRQLLVLDSSAVVPVVEEKTGDSEWPASQQTPASVDVGEVRDLLEKMSLEEKRICPALSEFRLTGWDGKDMSSVCPKSLSEFAFDPHGEMEHASDDDEASLPGDLEPDDLRDISDNEADGPEEGDGGDSLTHHLSNMKGDSQTAEFINNAFNDLTQGNTGKLMQILSSQPSDYSYFNKVIMRTWAGPAHWKTAPMSRDSSLRSLSTASKGKPRRPPFQLTYEKAGDLEGKFKASKATALTKATLQKYSKKKTTLPEDLHFQADNLFRLFHRHNIMIKRQDTGTVGDIDDGIGSYDYDNANDRENFCPDLGADDNDDNQDMGFNFSDDSRGFSEASHSQMSQPSLADNDSVFNATSLTGDKLLSQPYKVAKIDISYAKTAKRVDVRKLKTAMWSVMTSTSPAAQDQGKPAETEEGRMPGEWTFQSLLDVLPTKLSSASASSLSVPIAFICLLHLANEKTLKIFDKEMSDLNIDQDL